MGTGLVTPDAIRMFDGDPNWNVMFWREVPPSPTELLEDAQYPHYNVVAIHRNNGGGREFWVATIWRTVLSQATGFADTLKDFEEAMTLYESDYPGGEVGIESGLMKTLSGLNMYRLNTP